MANPRPSLYKQQSKVLAELKSYPKSTLRHVQAIRVTDALGRTVDEPWAPLSSLRSAEDEAALRALAKLRLRLKQDDQPCRVVPDVFVGGAGAARNLKALRKRGITHIVNAAPTVPCHFADNPEGCFTYLALHLFDDPEADLAPHIDACNAFVARALAGGGAVLVHCYAGQSRSAALVIAHLISAHGMAFLDAWACTRRARPCAQPNSGFLRQLSLYAQQHARRHPSPGSSPPSDCESEGQLALTQ